MLERETTDEMHVDPIFERGTNFIWTGDDAADDRGWVVYFYEGRTLCESGDFNASVRVVRTL